MGNRLQNSSRNWNRTDRQSPDGILYRTGIPGSPGKEIGAKGREIQVTHYKTDGQIKRQARGFDVSL